MQCRGGRRSENARRRANIVLLQSQLLHLLQLLLHLLLNFKFSLIHLGVKCTLFFGVFRVQRWLLLR